MKRYTDDMLLALSNQTLPSLLLNAAIRSAIFVAFIQSISFASGQGMSGLIQTLVLIIIFTFVIFSIDVVEKYWAVERLKKRG